MTNEDLLTLRELAQKAKPFTEEDFDREEIEEDAARRRANADFFLTVHPITPALIDELLAYRQKYGGLEGK